MPRKTNLPETPAPRAKAAAPQAAPKRHRKAAAPAAPAPLPDSAAEATTQDIATLAFSYWEQRGFSGGSPQADWFRAERELRSAHSQA